MASESLTIKNLIQESELYSLIDELKIGIYLFDSSGHSLWANIYFQSMFGYSMDELNDKTLYDLFPTQDARLLQKGLKQDNFQIRGKRNSQHFIYLKVLSCQQRDGLGTIVKVVDITVQKQCDYQLSKTNKELEDLKHALDQAATVSITDVDGKILYVNDKFCEISQYTRHELIGNNHRIIKSGHHPKEVYEEMWSTIKDGKVWKGEICNKTKGGAYWWGDATIVPFLDETGRPYQFIGIRSDITDKKRMEEKVQKSNELIMLSENRFRSLVEHSHDLIVLVDEKGIIEYISPNMNMITSTQINEYIGQSFIDFIHDEDQTGVKNYFADVIKYAQKSHTLETRVMDENGEVHICEVIFINLLHDPAVKAIKVNVRDITEKIQAEKKIYEMSNYDFRTKLPNKNLFRSLLRQELEHSKQLDRKFTLMVLDIHGLKFVNDTLDANMGEHLLLEAAKRLNEYIGEMGIVSHYEGVEFTILLPNIANHVTKKIAKDLIRLFEQPFFINDYELFLIINIGISIFPYTGQSAQSLLKNAYTAVHQANERGTNVYQVYSQNMDIKSFKKFNLMNDLRKAIKNNEFYLDFQPRIDVESNQIIAAEALIRWNHPKWGIVSPAEFISIAEESGIIGKLGEWVLENACQQRKEWQEKELPPVKVSVNLSVLQFLQTDVVQMVEKVLERTQLEAKWLEIEMTESVLMENESLLPDKIAKLKAMGIGIAIDDFGTGYSSLGYLKKIKADILKIDRSFIKGIPDDSDSKDIVSAVVQLAKKLKIRIVAEGVETQEQLEFLKGVQCEEVQGYLYSKPLEAKDFERLLEQETCQPNNENTVSPYNLANRREYFRIKMKHPLSGEMTITVFNGKKVNVGSTKILILDIGPGGLKVETTVKLPVGSDMVLKFSTKILGANVELFGKIVWRKEMDDHYHSYGVSFIIKEEARGHLTALLNQFQIQLQAKDVLPNSSFITDSKESFFESIS
ncbi:EAL domain-containing protein [Niallia endozanthoxylica]|uniref:EAL domain-containing protein n=1 Tax=Niallia endozanthoxylica TaxID=2036016 RepID=A0A5J5HPJ9_9BACI|nr:EAL domain-containing protein [Niallia endozanthoxylica]KAA9022060.1 EAL domain-containing protein [Niallia endozanthoxylica]